MGKEMAKALKSGLMEANTRASGATTKLTVMGSCIMRTKTCMRESGRMTRRMEEEFIFTQMERSTMGIGRKISSMDSESKPGQMELFMKADTLKAKRTEGGNSLLQMALFMKEISK